MVGNPNIVEDGKATQYGTKEAGGRSQDIAGANKPWSVHNAIRRAAAALDISGKPNAQMIGEKVVEMAKEGNLQAAEFVTERVDGKLVQPTTDIPPPKKYNFDNMTEEEAEAAYNALCNK